MYAKVIKKKISVLSFGSKGYAYAFLESLMLGQAALFQARHNGIRSGISAFKHSKLR